MGTWWGVGRCSGLVGRSYYHLREREAVVREACDFDKVGFVGVILCDPLFWNVRRIFSVPRLGTVSGWVLGFNRICPAYQGVMHRRKLLIYV